MRQGFVKVAAVTSDVQVADCRFNGQAILDKVKICAEEGAKVVVFPELAITGYTCGDLFGQEILLTEAKKELDNILMNTKDMDMLLFVGLPWEVGGKLYNCMAVLSRGELLGLVPKVNIPNYSVYYEARNFAPGNEKPVFVKYQGKEVPFGANILFACEELEDFVVAAEVCEDLWVACPPSIRHAMAGATVIANSSASDESVGKEKYRMDLIKGQSAKLLCGYICANAGEGESTTDLVFSGHNLIAENGNLLAESKRFENQAIFTEIDLGKLKSERRRMLSHPIDEAAKEDYVTVPFHLQVEETVLTRKFPQMPFVPETEEERGSRLEEIFTIQAMGLKKRITHTHAQSAVIGISGGLDSTLALLVAVRAFDLLGLDRKNIVTVTMPCFGTTDRTYQNAVSLCKQLGTTFKEVSIVESVKQHFKDIGHDENNHNVVYENAQARERTQILMDVANMYNGMVIGTGDLSELALGWATYNGDHMSMYGVNGSVPKTLVRHLVGYYADTCENEETAAVLRDVLDTPVSPELLPPKDGVISQKTEDLVGPYELHDFYLYYMMRFGFTPKKLYRIAKYAFAGVYDEETILKWLKTFYRRFFQQQFKRSCLPDGPRVGSVCVSPRGDLRMPSDACATLWLKELEELE